MRLFPALLAVLTYLFFAPALVAETEIEPDPFMLTKETLVCKERDQLLAQFDQVFASNGQNQALVRGCHWFDPPLRLVEDELGPYMDKGYPVIRHDHATVIIGEYMCTLVEFVSEMVNGFACADLIHIPRTQKA